MVMRIFVRLSKSQKCSLGTSGSGSTRWILSSESGRYSVAAPSWSFHCHRTVGIYLFLWFKRSMCQSGCAYAHTTENTNDVREIINCRMNLGHDNQRTTCWESIISSVNHAICNTSSRSRTITDGVSYSSWLTRPIR